eukprot:s600_g7.t1
MPVRTMLAALAFAPLAIARSQAAARSVNEENNDVKSVEVSDGQARIQELTGLAAEANASAQSLATEMSALATEVNDATAALDAARVLHANQVETFNGNEKSLYKDIEAVEAASTAISGGEPALMQIPEGRLKELHLQNASEFLQEVSAKLQDAVTRRAQRLDNTLSVRDHERLEAFFQDPAGFAKGLSLMQQAPIGGELAGSRRGGMEPESRGVEDGCCRGHQRTAPGGQLGNIVAGLEAWGMSVTRLHL